MVRSSTGTLPRPAAIVGCGRFYDRTRKSVNHGTHGGKPASGRGAGALPRPAALVGATRLDRPGRWAIRQGSPVAPAPTSTGGSGRGDPPRSSRALGHPARVARRANRKWCGLRPAPYSIGCSGRGDPPRSSRTLGHPARVARCAGTLLDRRLWSGRPASIVQGVGPSGKGRPSRWRPPRPAAMVGCGRFYDRTRKSVNHGTHGRKAASGRGAGTLPRPAAMVRSSTGTLLDRAQW